MCILVVLRDRVKGWPIVVGANRDEYRDRPWEPPRRSGAVLAPRDLRAGGTWLALHDAGLLVAVTNRPDDDHDASRPSRGLLAMRLARTGDPAAARDLLERDLARERRNAFRVLVASATDAWVGVHPGPDGTSCGILPVTGGLHWLTNLRGLDELDHRGALDPVDLPPGSSLELAKGRLRAALASHEDRGPAAPDTICKHGAGRGTLSSSLVGLPEPGAGVRPFLLFAAGAPCETEYAPAEEGKR